MLWHVLQYLVGGRLERHYLSPFLLFKFFGFEWVDRLPPAAMQLHFILLAVAAILIALGLFYRIACAYFALGITYVFLLDEAAYQNHTYLICLLAILMFFVPAHREFSLDALRRPALRAQTVPAWALWLLRFQVGIPYVFGGIAKINGDWLLRAEPMRLWLEQGTEGPMGGHFPKGMAAAFFLTWSGMLFDLLIVPALLWRRTRWIAVGLGMGFHLLNSQLFSIGVFPWLMIAATTLFFEPDWARRVGLIPRGKVAGKQVGKKTRKGHDGVPSAAPAPPPPPLGRLGRIALAAWVGIQLLLPLRHFAYPGNVDWTEEGTRFSWRMKLRDKQGPVRFTAIDPNGRDTGRGCAQPAAMGHDGPRSGHDPPIRRGTRKAPGECRIRCVPSARGDLDLLQPPAAPPPGEAGGGPRTRATAVVWRGVDRAARRPSAEHPEGVA